MKKLVRKILTMLTVCVTLVGTVGCGTRTTTENKNANYPYSNYLYQTAYAVDSFMAITSRDKGEGLPKYRVYGERTIDELVTEEVKGFGDKGSDRYTAMVFQFKKGAVLKSVTFTITNPLSQVMDYKYGVVGYTKIVDENNPRENYGYGKMEAVSLNPKESKTITIKYGNGEQFIDGNGETAYWGRFDLDDIMYRTIAIRVEQQKLSGMESRGETVIMSHFIFEFAS